MRHFVLAFILYDHYQNHVTMLYSLRDQIR